MSDDSKKRKRNRVGTNKRWTGEEELLILNYLLDLAPRNQEFEVSSVLSCQVSVFEVVFNFAKLNSETKQRRLL